MPGHCVALMVPWGLEAGLEGKRKPRDLALAETFFPTWKLEAWEVAARRSRAADPGEGLRQPQVPPVHSGPCAGAEPSWAPLHLSYCGGPCPASSRGGWSAACPLTEGAETGLPPR